MTDTIEVDVAVKIYEKIRRIAKAEITRGTVHV